jgi:Ca2+-binding EF-hand superfamily protein
LIIVNRTESKEVVDKVFKILDENTDGVISRTEFITVFKRLYLNYKELKEILNETDFSNPLSIKEKNMDLEQRSSGLY